MNLPALLLDAQDAALIARIQQGLPLVPHPYALLGWQLGLSEQDVLRRLKRLCELDVIKRFGVIVRHHELGYRANAMVVWDVSDDRIRLVGQCLARYPFVTLSYQRPRRLPEWPYNLFTMIHGYSREAVVDRVAQLVEECDLTHIAHEILFSLRRFKQRGAHYRTGGPVDARQERERA